MWETLQGFVNIPRMRTMKHKEWEGGESRSDWLQGIRPNGNQRLWDVRTTIDLYVTCSPEICHTYTRSKQNKRGGRSEKVWAQCHGSNGARGLAKETLKDEWEMEERRAGGAGSEEKMATSAGSYLDQPFVLWKEPCASACTSSPRMLDCNGWAAVSLISYQSFALLPSNITHSQHRSWKWISPLW